MSIIINRKNTNLTEYKFTIISDVSTKEASKSSTISLKNVIELIKTPNETIIEARRHVDTDPEKYKNLKRRLPVLLPYELADKSDNGTFSNLNRIWTQSFLMYFDVDHISKDDCDALKGELSLVEGVAFIFETTSGQGLRIATLVEGITESNYDDFYCKAMKYFNAYFGIVCDRACGNPGRKSFISYDPDPYVNYDCGFFNNTINASNISLDSIVSAKKKTNNKNKSKTEGKIKLEYLHKAQQFKNVNTVLDATSFVLFVLKDIDFKMTDGSGRHETLFYHVILTGLRLGIPPQILEKGIWVEPDNFMDLALTIQIGHAKLLKERIDSPKNQNLVLMERFLQAAMDLDSANKAAQAPAQPAPNSPAGGPAAPVPHVQGGPPTVNQAMAPKGGEFTTNKIKQ